MKACTATGCTTKSLRNSQLCMAHVKRKHEIGREIQELAGDGAYDWSKLRSAARKALEQLKAAKSKPKPDGWRRWPNSYEGVVIHQTAATPRKRGDSWAQRDYQKDSLADMMKLWDEKMGQKNLGHGVPPEWSSGWAYSTLRRVEK